MTMRQRRRRMPHRWTLRIKVVSPAKLWADKRRRQREFLASGRNGSWFAGGVTRGMRIINAPY